MHVVNGLDLQEIRFLGHGSRIRFGRGFGRHFGHTLSFLAGCRVIQ
jgi:hypothetical protein